MPRTLAARLTLATVATALCMGFLGLPTTAEAQDLPCRADDRACAIEKERTHAVTRADFWKSALAKPMAQRIAAAPPELIEYLRLDNIKGEIPNQPHAPSLKRGFMPDLKRAFARLPPRVKALLEHKLAGIYLVDDLGGTGYTNVVYDANGLPVAGFIVLDAAVLATRRANAWATWKENTPFKPDPAVRLVATIEKPGRDTRENAIQYILLHELAHVISIGTDLHPPWTITPAEQPASVRYAFFDLSWTVDRAADSHVSRFDSAFPARKDVAYYFGARLDGAAMPAVYASLANTNFPTLYAATSPGDDFAESFASYVHTVLMGRPFRIRITRDGRTVQTLLPCWKAARCDDKRAILERLLGVP